MKKNILVFPCGSEIGLDVYSSARYSTHFHLIGASSVDDHGVFVYEDYIPGLPFITDPGFIPTLKRIVQERRIDAIYPAMDAVITLLKKNESELGCIIVSSPEETTEICLSKSKTYQVLSAHVRTPKQYSKDQADGFPLFVKPDIGYGSIGAMVVHDKDQLATSLRTNPNLLILEYLPGEEFTVDCFTDRKGNLLYAAARKRNRIRNGISVNTSFAENQACFQEFAEIINSRIAFRGAWFFQLKRDSSGELCLLEVASRLGGSSLLSRAKGVNLTLMSLYDAFGIDVSVVLNDSYSVTLDRALDCCYHCEGLDYDVVYVDYDDCLVLDKTRVNTQLVRFLFQCLNENKRIVLLSKHSGDLDAELRHFRLDHIFDEVIHIPSSHHKIDYIAHPRAIFIDDSFSEREQIHRALGLPVFSPDMIDVLNS